MDEAIKNIKEAINLYLEEQLGLYDDLHRNAFFLCCRTKRKCRSCQYCQIKTWGKSHNIGFQFHHFKKNPDFG